MFMPLSTLITSDIMYNTAVGQRMMKKENIKKADKIFLYYYLMQERQKVATGRARYSPCRTYIQSLPANFSSFPMFFTPQELEYLEGSPFKNDIIVQIKTATDLFNAMCVEIPDFK